VTRIDATKATTLTRDSGRSRLPGLVPFDIEMPGAEQDTENPSTNATMKAVSA
jgi:hypothetical protein